MTHADKRAPSRRHLLLPALLLTALAACTGEAASGTDQAGSTSTSAVSPEDRTLAYAQCMRDDGVPEFPDPNPDGGLRIGSEVDPNSAAFKNAQQACQDLAPQGAGGGGAPLDSAKVADWAQCIRDNGVPSFPDPEINGGSMQLDFGAAGMSRDDPAFQSAMDACRSKWPGGGVMIQGGGQ